MKLIRLEKVKFGDLLCGEVLSHRSSGHYYISINAALGDGKRKNLVGCDIVAHMKSVDTDPKEKDSDSYGNWKIYTQLFVEVLNVSNHGGSSRLRVGTKGITLRKYQRRKFFLGKVAEPFPVTEASWDERSPSYSKALLKCKTFNSPSSIQILCEYFKLNIKMNSSSARNISIRGDLFEDSASRLLNHVSPSPGTTVIDLDSDDSDEIQVTKVELSKRQKAEFLIREAIAYYRAGKYELAMEKLDGVFAVDPTNIMALVALGSVTYKLGDSLQALQFLNRALALEPNNLDAIIAKASIKGNNGDLDGAFVLLESAMNMDPPLINDSRFEKAKSYYCQVAEEMAEENIDKGNKQKAITFYEKILKVDPENIEVQRKLSLFKKNASRGSVEVICLDSDEEEENLKEEIPTEISRSEIMGTDDRERIYTGGCVVSQDLTVLERECSNSDSVNQALRDVNSPYDELEHGDVLGHGRSPAKEQSDMSDVDQEDNQVDNNFSSRVLQFLEHNVDRHDESNDLSVNRRNNFTDEAERSNSERECEKYDQNCSVINKDIPGSQEFENTKIDESVVGHDINLEKIVSSENNNCAKSNISEVESLSTTLSEQLEENDNEISCSDINSQIIDDCLHKEYTNNKIIDKKQNENIIKPKKIKLPKLRRLTNLPTGCMADNNSSNIINTQNIPEVTNQNDYSKRNQSQSEMSNNKEVSNNLIENNLSHNNVIEKKTDGNVNNNQNIELTNAEEPLLERENSYDENKILNRIKEKKSEDSKKSQHFKLTSTKGVHNTQNISRRGQNFDNRENIEKKKNEEAVSSKSRSREKNEISQNKKDEMKEIRKNKKHFEKSEKSSSKSSRDTPKKYSENVKQVFAEQKKSDKSKEYINSHQNTSDYLETSPNNLEEDIFGIKRNTLNTMEMDDFDLPDIESRISESHSENYDPQTSKEKIRNKNDEEYDEFNELKKDLEKTTSIENLKEKKKKTEHKNQKKNNLSNVKSKKTCEFLERIRKENEKTEKKKSEISNRSMKEIKRDIVEKSLEKEKDGRRAILLTDPIAPPSEIRKRRRRRNADLFEDEEEIKNRKRTNGDLHEDEEEITKKKCAKKPLNEELPYEAIAGPSNAQNTLSLVTPTKHSSEEIQTPTHKNSSSQKKNVTSEKIPANKKDSEREGYKNLVSKALCNRYVLVKKEFKHIDESDINDLAENIELEVYKLFKKDNGKAYKAKLRELCLSIRNKSNEILFRKILNREVSPKKLVKMDKLELAPEKLAKWREMRNERELDAIVQTEREKVTNQGQVILKNHKGELEIQNEYEKEALETLNELPEDLSIDEKTKSSRGNKSKKEKNRHKTSRR